MRLRLKAIILGKFLERQKETGAFPHLASNLPKGDFLNS